MYRIDNDLKSFLESGVAVLVGTGDDNRRPHLAYGWGPRVVDESTVQVFLDTERATDTLADLKANGQIAMTVAHPVSYRSLQLKGKFRESFDADEDDTAWVQRRREEFLVSTSLIGDPPGTVENLWLDEVVGITFSVERAFDQTPGPNAGTPL